ncbi:DUF4003 family protein [Radiobacillus deserti]|uniref:DUF4003 domain-containing protein n=1 Tax=Radiobacillus deserti TaxID=2594883 RepID=A0A516KEL0_9BACI|nr:DUF4003 family protein [Radiobacillus deserti]QDP39845.1 DUF4003 domain-containing protein [Radiobacillus deserti]
MNKREQYVATFLNLKKKMKWRPMNKRSLMLIAATYVIQNKPFDWNRFRMLSDYIKYAASVFSPLKSNHRYVLAAKIDTGYDHPEKAFSSMLEAFEALDRAGFWRNEFSYIAATVLLDEGDNNFLAERARHIYDAMRKEHSFITSNSDYPLAALLAKEEGSVRELIETMEYFYSELNKRGFKKGDALQFLSHILSLDNGINRSILIQRCATILHALEDFGIKRKRMYYPVIGLLAFVNNGESLLPIIQSTWNELNEVEAFIWNEDLNLLMAVNIIVSDQFEQNEIMLTGLTTTIESIVQAQEAASTAAWIGAMGGISSN